MRFPLRAAIVRVSTLCALSVALCGCAEVMSGLDPYLSTPGSTPEEGLREALRVGTGRAVEQLSKAGGYSSDPELRIPVPRKFEKVADALELIGAGDQVDEFVASMNRAAEAAAPAAKEVFIDSIREMTFDDALTILRGDAHEATDYFREHASPRLEGLFRPIVAGKLDSVGATRAFNELAEETARIPFVEKPVFDLTDYVTDEALDGLFRAIAREEERIREDPVARTTELLKTWFGQPH